ncbi:MAG TPA: flagellar motor protein MotB [Planctomycetota bacterium]
MALKHRPDERVNHERWLVSFADMMTLLFALFVVLYAMGVQNLDKLRDLKKSIEFAFHISGEGKTKQQGIFSRQSGAGDLDASVPLITAQDGEMREFLQQALRDYEEIAGRSLEIVQTDDSVSLTAPLSDFFAAGLPSPVKREVQAWLERVFDASLTFTSTIRIRLEVPDVLIGKDETGRALTSIDLCSKRVMALRLLALENPRVLAHTVNIELVSQLSKPGEPVGNWEEKALVIIAFSNARPENR